eukprot:TRINITY_DN18113_c0_g1_i1.p1 TRINITY_DN18113_c0_g1~~TRINITY_DN18113_c0_g1_i1.p1  ORF type:complete len:409 (+),score=87.94 TRINITY_DN18113_c0_g1_i1:44-1228(+)
MVRFVNLYDILEVDKDANKEDIKIQYKRISIRHKITAAKQGQAAKVIQERMRQTAEAYRILGNPDRRKQYNKHGVEEGDLSGVDEDEMFCSVFGGVQKRGRRKAPDIVFELAMSLDSLYNGKTTRIAVIRKRLCSHCDSLGTKKEGLFGYCSSCGGRGEIHLTRQMTSGHSRHVSTTCPDCTGSGTVVRPQDYCTYCKGELVVKEKRTFDITITPGMQEGDHFTFQGEGDEEPGCSLPGDVFVIIVNLKHDTFRRKGDHLLLSYELSLVEALCGFYLPLNHLDGRQLVIQPPKGVVISPYKYWQVEGEGMPIAGSGSFGNLIIQFTVSFPDSLPQETTTQISRILTAPPQPILEDDYLERTLTLADRSIFSNCSEKREGDDALPAGNKAVCQHQ